MTDEKIDSKKALKTSILSLSIVAASRHGAIFDLSGGSEQVLALLQWATKSQDPEVNELFMEVGQRLSTAHLRFFERNGVVFEPLSDKPPQTRMMTYRGKSTTKVVPAKTEPNVGKGPNLDGKRGKRKIMYRGQEKWV